MSGTKEEARATVENYRIIEYETKTTKPTALDLTLNQARQELEKQFTELITKGRVVTEAGQGASGPEPNGT